jgi:hypothetical protein
MFKSEIKYIRFHNNSNLPVIVEAWVNGSNTLQSAVIEGGRKIILHSSVGEWHLTSMFDGEQIKEEELWEKAGLSKCSIIGKFRSNPCAMGNYSWMDYNIFQCKHTKVDGDYDIMTFTIVEKPL